MNVLCVLVYSCCWGGEREQALCAQRSMKIQRETRAQPGNTWNNAIPCGCGGRGSRSRCSWWHICCVTLLFLAHGLFPHTWSTHGFLCQWPFWGSTQSKPMETGWCGGGCLLLCDIGREPSAWLQLPHVFCCGTLIKLLCPAGVLWCCEGSGLGCLPPAIQMQISFVLIPHNCSASRLGLPQAPRKPCLLRLQFRLYIICDNYSYKV